MGMIRLFLALSVLVWHVPARPFTLLDAQVAVLFFFITSGFYMALTINESYARPGTPPRPGWRRAFYLSRILRLYPAYLATVAVMVFWFACTHTANVFLNHPNVPPFNFLLLVLMNVFILGQDFFQCIVNTTTHEQSNGLTAAVLAHTPPDVFENIWMMVGQAWSLGSELLFYAMAPFLVRSPRRLILCLAAGLALRWGLIFGLHGYDSTIWGYNFFPATACLFCLGSLAYHLYPRLRPWRLAGPSGGVITAFFALFAAFSLWRWHGILLVGPAGLDCVPLWSAYLLYALSLPLLFACWRANRADRWIGELSYPLYLVHGGIIGFLNAHCHLGPLGLTALAMAISLATATAVFQLIDRPVDAWRHRHFGAAALAVTLPPTRRREAWVLAALLGLILANTLRLAAFAPPTPAPPILVADAGRYNIVRYNGRFFGLPKDDPVTFGAPGFDQDKRLIIAATRSAVLARITP